MSYFPQHASRDLDELAAVATMSTARDEIADGVTIERRGLLRLSAAAFAACVGSAPRMAAQSRQDLAPPTDGKLGHAELLAELLPQARQLIASGGKDEETYLLAVASALLRLREPNAPIGDAMSSFRKQQQREGERFPLGFTAMRLKPGGGFAPHDHLDYNGVILGVEGEVRIRNFDFCGEVPALDSGKTFEIRETRDDLILPGRFSTLGQRRENVHELVAGEAGALVLDLFTFFSPEAGSRYLEVAEKPRDAARRIYEATWRTGRR
ncbi:MAG: hypothetical protein JNM84_08025 [Planctomycetes bacterium]|nr:hypothetical protein [Planctomycetota bacterium]